MSRTEKLCDEVNSAFTDVHLAKRNVRDLIGDGASDEAIRIAEDTVAILTRVAERADAEWKKAVEDESAKAWKSRQGE